MTVDANYDFVVRVGGDGMGETFTVAFCHSGRPRTPCTVSPDRVSRAARTFFIPGWPRVACILARRGAMLRARRLATALAIATILGTTGSEPSTIADNSAASILLKLDAVARAYLTTALRIECAEAIEWTDHRVMSRGELISKYIFVRDG
jgi:hypothetical protein